MQLVQIWVKFNSNNQSNYLLLWIIVYTKIWISNKTSTKDWKQKIILMQTCYEMKLKNKMLVYS